MTKEPTTTANAARIEGMAQWAAGVKTQLAELEQAMFVTIHDRADGISLELATLKDKRRTHAKDYAAALNTKAALSVDNDLDDAIASIEAQTLLDVSAELKENGKPNACFHSWGCFGGDEAGYCSVLVVLKTFHTYENILRSGEWCINFPSADQQGQCMKTIENNSMEKDEILERNGPFSGQKFHPH